MKFVFGLFIGLLISSSSLVLILEYPLDSDFFEVDHLGNVYAVQGNTVSVLDKKGKVKHSFSDISSGEITSIDVSNPLKIIVYFRNTGRINLLDNQLSLHNDPLDLFQLVDRDIQLAANSGSNYLWVYDQFSNQILQVDYALKIYNATGVLANFLSQSFMPAKIIEKNEKLYVLGTNNTMAVFDVFGSFLYKISLPQVDDFQIEKDQLIYQQGNALVYYNLTTHLQSSVSIPEKREATIKKQGNFYYSFSKGMMRVYQ